MSTFDGKIREIHGISVDRFDGENLRSATFFLSHCHTDHMVGLKLFAFQQKLINENRRLYLSNISAIILRNLIPSIANQIEELPLNQSTSITVRNKDISVTCIPAGHCPGSVMFLFETNEVSVLYTGDYRIKTTDVPKFKCFYDTFGNVKRIDKIYLDTTFFMESYRILPNRKDSLSELCKIISRWISEDPEHCVKLDVRAKYGYEYVFKEIFNNLNMPVHVDQDKYDFYSAIPELHMCVTTIGSSTRIHCCVYGQGICNSCDRDKLRIIKLSAFRWENWDFSDGLSTVDENGIVYVCYSTHASYQEGIALIDFLKPKDIHVCVERPNDPVNTIAIKKLVEKHIRHVNTGIPKPEPSPTLFEVRNFQSEYHGESSCEILIDLPPQKLVKTDNILDSPPR